MKQLGVLCLTLACISTAYSQEQKDEAIRPDHEISVEYHGLTGRLDQFKAPVGTVNEITKTLKTGYHPKHDWPLNDAINPNALPQGEDPALQKEYPDPAPATKALTANWDGISNFNVSPADPAVDVGPNHVVHMTNGPSGAYIQIYSKTGTPIGSQVYFDNFMSMPGGLGDPIVLYDERADRWMLSEFSQNGNNMHVAISQTADPGGAYHTYSFNAPSFPDYPKYSIWEDAYIITTNETGDSPIYALNRADLLSGAATTAQRFTVPSVGTIGFQAMTPVSMLGTTLPPANTPPMVMRMRDDAWGSGSDAIEVYNVNIDWANSGNSSVTANTTLNMSLPFDSNLCGFTSFSCIDQPGSNTNLDPLRELLMNRIMYRNFGTHESIVCCHVTDVSGNDQAGIRWYEIRRTGGAAGSWTIYQESTYSPDTDSRWMPTIGLSASGNIGLAYNVSSSTTFPSIRYTGRKSCDPLNMMTEAETVIAAGTSPNGSNRYGDYNAMGVDPSDGETFYMTAIYNPNSAGRARVAAFDIPVCNLTPEVSFENNTYSAQESDGATANASNDCLPYTDISIPIMISAAPSQNADVTVSVSGGTATAGVDFDLLNASQTLATGTLSANVTIRVYNDDYVEGNETITLSYTLNANGGDAVAGSVNQTTTITISDDDLAPAAATTTSTVLSENFESGFGGFTTVNPSGDTPWQIGNTAAASTAAYTVPASNATNFAWINDDACNCNQNDVDLVFPSVDLSSYTASTLTFSTYFEDNTYQGDNENADLYVSVNGGADALVGPLTSSGVDGPWVTQNFDLTPYVGNNNVIFKVKYSDATGWLYGCTVDDVLITGAGPIAVQTAINTGTGDNVYLGPNETVHVYDPTSGNVMMTLENTSSFDYGCVDIEVDRAGTNAVQFNTATAADYLHSKTYTVSPTNNNPSGSYNVTLYYEEAEVAGWETATGNSRNNAEIVKVNGSNQISDVTPATAASYTIENNSATLGAFNSDVTFTSSFSTGFSGFGVGIYNPNLATAPTANFTAPAAPLCEGSTISFTDQSTGSPTSWTWDFGDGSGTSSQQNPTHTYASFGTYTVNLTASNSAGSNTFALTITVSATSSSSQSFSICPGQSVTVGTSTYTSAGTFTDVLTNAAGCDSTITTTVTMLAPTSFTQNVSFCPGGSVTVGTSTYTSAGTFTDVLTNAAGCDSTVTTNVTVLSPTSFSWTTEICPGSSVTVGTSTYTSAGTFTDVLTNAAGCDSTVTTTVTVTNNVSFTQDISICQGQSFTVGTSTYNSTGTYTDVFTSASGCDSTVTTNLTVNVPSTFTQNVSFCPGGSVTVGTSTYTSAGTFTDVLTNAAGCDSTVTTNVTVLSPTSSTQNVSFCPGGSVTVGTSTYTSAGTFTDVLTNAAGCDSTVTTNVTLLSPTSSTQDVEICQGNSYSIGSSTYTSTGTYTDVLTNAAGCDSTVTTNLTVVNTITNNQDITICQGESVTVGTSTYTSTGTYTDVLTSAGGCDSIITTNLTVLNAVATSQDITICQGESVTVGTSTYTSAGTFTDVLTNAAGCDSTVTTNVTVLTPSSSSQDIEICQGETITVGSNTYSTSGTYTDVFTNAAGCDSTVTTNLTVHPRPTVLISPSVVDTMCINSAMPLTIVGTPAGGTFTGTGMTGTTFYPSTAGIGTHVITYDYTDGNGCSSSATLTIVVDACAGTDEIALEGVDLFPNPNEGEFTVSGLEIGTGYRIYDDRGRLVSEGNVNSNNQLISLPEIQKGIYYLHATSNGKTGSIKFLIVK